MRIWGRLTGLAASVVCALVANAEPSAALTPPNLGIHLGRKEIYARLRTIEGDLAVIQSRGVNWRVYGDFRKYYQSAMEKLKPLERALHREAMRSLSTMHFWNSKLKNTKPGPLRARLRRNASLNQHESAVWRAYRDRVRKTIDEISRRRHRFENMLNRGLGIPLPGQSRRAPGKSPSSAIRPCSAICGNQTDAKAKAWCMQHCRD